VGTVRGLWRSRHRPEARLLAAPAGDAGAVAPADQAFGLRHSSLGYLNRMPVDGLKIDRVFVQRIGRNPRDVAIVSAIIGMADTLGLSVVAEGVETEEQHDALLELGCRLAQGFRFAPAIAPDKLAAMVRRGPER
jgi:EAL domain-containing protein (putative c-di-GMP-specific phosphodiesterase class I)